MALYRSSRGKKWKKRQNWGTKADLSQWYGVKVNDQGRVVKLSLVGENLRGMTLAYFTASSRTERLCFCWSWR